MTFEDRQQSEHEVGGDPEPARRRLRKTRTAKFQALGVRALAPSLVDADEGALHHTVEHEGPAGAVPDPHRHEGDEDRDADADREQPPAIESPLRGQPVEGQRKRLKNVGDDKTLQRHVPAAPVVDDAGGPERRVKIERQFHAQHPAEADGHVGIG